MQMPCVMCAWQDWQTGNDLQVGRLCAPGQTRTDTGQVLNPLPLNPAVCCVGSGAASHSPPPVREPVDHIPLRDLAGPVGGHVTAQMGQSGLERGRESLVLRQPLPVRELGFDAADQCSN